MKLKTIKTGTDIINVDDISSIDYSQIEQLKITILTKNCCSFPVNGINALEITYQLNPSALEGKRLNWPKFMWIIHNLIGHPLMQILALFGLYKWAFWIHDVTVPKPNSK